jgi:hypothetical protein
MKQNVFIELFIIRILLVLCIAYSKINPWLQIISILSLDFIKRYYIRFRCKKFIDVYNIDIYHTLDKFADLFGYVIVYKIITKNKLISDKLSQILLLTIVYRMIGLVLFYSTNNRKYLFYFVDLFKEFLVVFVFFTFGKNSSENGSEDKITLDIVSILILVVIVKLHIEYVLHIDKKNY